MQSLEYLIVLEVVSRPRGRDRERMRRALRDHPAEAIDAAVQALQEAGVVTATEHTIKPTLALQRLDQLGLIAV